MRARAMCVLGLSAMALFGAEACGSDASSKPVVSNDAGTGGKNGSGGKGGASGASGNGGAAAMCDTSQCDAQVSQANSLLGALGGGLSVKSCCVSATKCGIDASALGALLGGGTQLGCVDPSALTIPPAVDSGPPPVVVPIRVLDGGIIPVGDGGLPIQLDKSCPDITAPGVFDLPGCCRPSGTCGGSTHTLLGAGTTVALVCASYDDVAASSAAQFGNTVVVPDDPAIKCSYTAGGPPSTTPDASVDGGRTPIPDAGHPDAGNPPDASRPGPDAAGEAADARPD